MGPAFKPSEVPFPVLPAGAGNPESVFKPVPQRPLTFSTAGQSRDMTLSPLYKILDHRYTVYWKVEAKG